MPPCHHLHHLTATRPPSHGLASVWKILKVLISCLCILACLAFEGTPALHGSRHPLRQHSPLKSQSMADTHIVTSGYDRHQSLDSVVLSKVRPSTALELALRLYTKNGEIDALKHSGI